MVLRPDQPPIVGCAESQRPHSRSPQQSVRKDLTDYTAMLKSGAVRPFAEELQTAGGLQVFGGADHGTPEGEEALNAPPGKDEESAAADGEGPETGAAEDGMAKSEETE